MRYYRIVLTNPQTGAVIQPKLTTPGPVIDPASTFTSYVNGRSLPGALDVEMDINQGYFGAPGGGDTGAWVRVYGIDRATISQAQDLNNVNIQVFGGMQKGLPLANPAQAGLLLQGTVYSCLGNWIGNEMTLDFFSKTIASSPLSTSTMAQNLVVDWRAGTTLANALQNTLQVAFPGYKITITISSSLVLAHDEIGFYADLDQLAGWVAGLSRDINGGATGGVKIYVQGLEVIVLDDTYQPKAKQIAFNDLIGQPTWLSPQLIQVHLVMRGDLELGDVITLPQTAVTTIGTAVSSQFLNKSIFQGSFQINAIRHVGRFRVPDGTAWVTIADLSALPASASTSTSPLLSAPVTPVIQTPLPSVVPQSQQQTIFTPGT